MRCGFWPYLGYLLPGLARHEQGAFNCNLVSNFSKHKLLYSIPKLAFSHTKIFNTFKCSGNNKKDSYEAPYKAIVSTGCRGQQPLQVGGCLWDGWEGEDEQLNPWLKFIGLNDVLGSSQQSSGLGRGQK